jgi:hypothetical protein
MSCPPAKISSLRLASLNLDPLPPDFVGTGTWKRPSLMLLNSLYCYVLPCDPGGPGGIRTPNQGIMSFVL